jgi:hypothetical protein
MLAERSGSRSPKLSLLLALMLTLLSWLSCDTSVRGPECGLEGFTEAPDEHIINEITEPFVVREVKGRIDNEAGPGWWKDCLVLFEIRGIRKDTEVHKVYADENGNFVMRDITEGRYCFKATVNGWQSVTGIIIVSKRADPERSIVFEMKLGV